MAVAAPAPPRPRRFGLALAGAAIILVGLMVLARLGPATSLGRTLIMSELNGRSLGSLGTLRLQGLAGDPWSDPRVARLTLTDANGVWLDARGLAVHWRPLELLERRVHITSAGADSLTLLHQPSLAGSHSEPGWPSIVTAGW